MEENKQNFVKGAMILIAAHMIVKVIGAVFKIPLNNLIGDDGMGLFGSAYNIYAVMFIVATSGFPVAISKMVSESTARNDEQAVQKIFKTAAVLLTVIGLTGALVLFFGADIIAKLLGNERAAMSIRAIAPTILFVSILSVFRGYFQGMRNMVPTGISEVIEAIFKLIVGYTFAHVFLNVLDYGIETASAGAVFGVTCSTFIALLVIAAIYFKKRGKSRLVLVSRNPKTTRQVLKQLVYIAIPITAGACVFSLANLIDMGMIMRRLQELPGITEEIANAIYGGYYGKAVTIFNMPPTLVTAVSISIVPAIAGALSVNKIESAKAQMLSAIRISLFIALPCAVGISMISEGIFPLLMFKDVTVETVESMKILAYAIISVAIVSVTTAIIQASGKVLRPVVHMAAGGLVKVAINFFLVASPQFGILGAPIGTNACYIVIMALNLIAIKKEFGVKYNIMQLVVKPLLAVGAMGIIIKIIVQFAGYSRLATIAAILGGGIVYLVIFIGIGGLTREDLLFLPKGGMIVKFLRIKQ